MPPFHPIDRSRLTRYVTSNRTRYALSAAYSSKLNPRNLEVDYYPPYNHALADLVNFEFDGALTVRQQYNLWLSKSTFDLYKVPPDALETANYYWFEDDEEDNSAEPVETLLAAQLEEVVEVEIEEEGEEFDIDLAGSPSPPMSSSPPHAPMSDRPRRNRNPPPVDPQDFLTSPEARAALNPNQELTQEELAHAMENIWNRARIVDKLTSSNPDATEADISIETIATVPDANGKDLYPDMLLCHSYAVEMDKPDNQKAVLGWKRRARCKVLHHCFPLIMEIKGCPTRFMRDEEMETRLASLLTIAASQLYEYVQAYFARDLCAKCVVAMTASGPHWQWTQVERREVATKVPTGLDDSAFSLLDIKLKGAFVSKLRRAPVFVLATEESDKELTRLRDEVLIPLIEDHHRYPSTMVPNPQR